MDPLAILPKELWQIIFGHVECCQDWLNLYAASPSFGEVVGDGKLQVLFTLVFPIVNKYLYDDDLNGMLGLRLVSKQWKELVDETLELETFGECMSKYDFSTLDKISIFLRNFATHPGNPLVGSFASFSMYSIDPEVVSRYQTLANRFMENYGMYVKKLTVTTASRRIGSRVGVDNFIRLLMSCVERAPNVERMCVIFSAKHCVDYPEETPLLQNQMLPIINLKEFIFVGRGKPSSLTNLRNIISRMCCGPETKNKIE